MLSVGCIGGGAGLLPKAMQDAGLKIVWTIDPDPIANTSFKENFPKAKIYCKSITEFDRLPKSDIIAITLPCQSFTFCNQNRKEDPQLLYYALYLVAKDQPKYYFFENVPNASKYFPKCANIKFFDMCQFGNKQKRKRMFYSNFDMGLLKTGTHSVPAVTKSGVGNWKFYKGIGWEEALERMGFKNLKLFGNRTQKLAQIGEGVVYEFGYAIAKRIMEVETDENRTQTKSEGDKWRQRIGKK